MISGYDYVCTYAFIPCVLSISIGQMGDELKLKCWDRCFRTVSMVLHYAYIFIFYTTWLLVAAVFTDQMNLYFSGLDVPIHEYQCTSMKYTSFSPAPRGYRVVLRLQDHGQRLSHIQIMLTFIQSCVETCTNR